MAELQWNCWFECNEIAIVTLASARVAQAHKRAMVVVVVVVVMVVMMMMMTSSSRSKS